jgi:hydroxymethylglutaryl-CoA synthase
MMDVGFVSAGSYAPRERVSTEAFDEAWDRFKSSGIETKAVAAPDEDAVTMAYEAGKRALAAGNPSASNIERLAFATTTPPTAEEDPTVQLAEMFGLSDEATVQLYTGSTRAGTQGLLQTVRDVEDGEHGLVVIGDCPRGEPETEIEHAAGAGAAAFVVGPSPAVEVRKIGRESSLVQGTRYRRTGEATVESLDITAYERDAFVRTIASAVERAGVDPAAVDAAAVQAPNGVMPYRAADAINVDQSAVRGCAVVHELGDLGAASVPVSLTRALDATNGSTILVTSFGSGAGADAFVLEATARVPVDNDLNDGRPLSYAEYIQRRGELTSGPPAGGGAYVSVPAWQRTIEQRYRLVGGECRNCQTLNFPPSGSCSQCHRRATYEPTRLRPRGTVEAVTVISRGGAPPAFTEQQARSGDFGVVIVALDGPDERTASVPAQVVDADPTTVAVGDRVRTTIRRIYTQEGVTRYGFKVRPA